VLYTNKRIFIALVFALSGFLQACNSGGGSTAPATGTLSGTVTTGNPATALANVSVIIFDANTNAPTNSSMSTDASGKYSTTLNVGSYYVKLYKQGYNPVPASALLSPVPFTITGGATTINDVAMTASTVSNGGWITGKVSNSAGGLGGVLVAAEAAGAAYTSISDSSGNYSIFNVPAASYTVKAYIAGYSSTAPAATVTASTATTTNLSVTANAAGVVPVTFNLIAQTGVTTPARMVVSLVHPVTRETIPGLSLSQNFSSSMSYSFSGVADGSYFVRASYANDTIVVDPDYIVKFGEPSVAVSSTTASPNPVQITATGAVGLVSPTNALSSTGPVLVNGTTPTFNWNAYPSANDYVVEVMDAATGAVIWGGFNGTGTSTPSKKVTTTSTSIVYNVDGAATAALIAGKTYRWRIYASKNDSSSLGWHLISMSEDQVGLFTVQ